jgi:ABC-type Fe3+/spermidine/putrescine transport system ATPase subunit
VSDGTPRPGLSLASVSESSEFEPLGAADTDARRAVVTLSDVTKRYAPGADAAVADLDLSVYEGEFFSLLGPSGSGKTTTLRMIAGFERPTVGRVHLDGVDVTDRPPYKRDVSTVFQNYALFPHMRVRENVGYPLKMRKVPKKELVARVGEALERVEMTGYEKRLPHQLSGGQRQRIALARALISRPKVMLLDEPLGALDLKLRENMLVVLKNLQRGVGITFVYVTHDQGEALAMSDRLAVMNAGRVEQIADPVHVYARPATSFVAGFIGKTNLLECHRGPGGQAVVGDLSFALDRPTQSEKFTISLRPEHIVVGAGDDVANRVSGVVREVLFLGHERELIVEAAGQRLVVRVGGTVPAAAGDRVELGWTAEAAVVVEDTGTWRNQSEDE